MRLRGDEELAEAEAGLVGTGTGGGFSSGPGADVAQTVDKEGPMYKRILIPTDGSELSVAAIKQAVALAKAVKAKVTGMTVSAPFRTFALDPLLVSDTAEEYQKDIDDRAERYLGVVTDAASFAGVPCETLHVMAEHPYEGIIKTARGKSCDLIFMASHGRRGISALLLGSETVKVLTHSRIPVLVSR